MNPKGVKLGIEMAGERVWLRNEIIMRCWVLNATPQIRILNGLTAG